MDDILLNTEEYILKAKDHIDSWDYIQAKRLLMEILEDQPDNGRAHQLLGWIYASQLNQYDMAEIHFKMAIRFEPYHTTTYSDYIYLLKMTSRYKEMVEFAEKAEKIRGINLAYIQRNKAEAFEMLRDYNNAASTYSEAIINALDEDLISSCERGIERIARKIKIKEQLDYNATLDVA
ncbi:hypothetical protein JMN32_21165 [Fulvivirga sp. 29W222]|uniref:Tetratricopeptide repeat protein n=1 Tax=Fulvivirga marina TaxID=2494733 RepID=A0A937G259_9BACT|nr:hypothetical protein [Fulvivirga marina]MBL6448836.1 hypothetical protein [Fulvivirga marina]